MQDLSGVQLLSGNIEAYRNRKDPEAIKAVAKEMESLFVYEMLKVMRESSGAPAPGGLGGDTYTSMFDMELSRVIAERGLGLSDMLARGISGKAPETKQPLPQVNQNAQKRTEISEIKNVIPEVANPGISSGYGMRHDPFTGELKFHNGLDIPAPEGTDIHPVRPGKVVFSGEQHGYGNVVIVDHGDGYVSKYAHNQMNLVKAGETVDTATILARVGSTGRSTGPHVHFEVTYQGRKIDPGTLLAMR